MTFVWPVTNYQVLNFDTSTHYTMYSTFAIKVVFRKREDGRAIVFMHFIWPGRQCCFYLIAKIEQIFTKGIQPRDGRLLPMGWNAVGNYKSKVASCLHHLIKQRSNLCRCSSVEESQWWLPKNFNCWWFQFFYISLTRQSIDITNLTNTSLTTARLKNRGWYF